MSAESNRASGSPPEERPESLAAALDVRRNARVGMAAGVGLAAVLYLRTVLGVDSADTRGYYLGLALVLAATLGAVITAALCAKTFLEPVLDRSAWLRRGGNAALAGGLAWALLPALAWLSGADLAANRDWRAATALATLALLVGAIALHAAVRAVGQPSSTSPAREPPLALRRVERGAYWVVLAGLALAAGNATGNVAPILETDAGPLATPFVLGAFLACLGAIPLAAAVELSGALPRWRAAALLGGALAAVLGVAWLVAAGGWPWLAARAASPAPLALALVTVPAGVGWFLAGLGVRGAAARLDARAPDAASSPGSPNG